MCQDHAGHHPAADPCADGGAPRDAADGAGPGRRALFASSAAAALTLGGVSFAPGAAAADGRGTGLRNTREEKDTNGTRDTRTVTGTLPPGCPDFVYLPVEVERGVRELHVSYTYDRPEVPPGTQGNALDIGLFDERGTALGGAGFRGWSGGARTEFFVRADEATPGYLAGPVNPGTWHIVLGPYTVAPDGLPYEVTVTLTRGAPAPSAPKPSYPPERARGRGRAWYRGDCHLHSWYSDGRRTPAEIAALARGAGLDFINSSDHNTNASHPFWADHAGDDLLIMLGEEITTRNGHVVALSTRPGAFVDWRYRARDNRFGTFAQEIHRQGGLVVPAHPHATCIACNWKFGFNEADAVEVWNGPYTADDEATLAEWDNRLTADLRRGHGGWLPAMSGSDAHRDPDVVGLPQTVVLADDLSRDAILAGIRAGHSYIAESSQVELALTVSGPGGEQAGIGERLRVADDSRVTVRFEVKGAPGCTTHLVTDEGTLFSGPALPASGAGTVEWQTTPQYAAYVRAEVRHPAVVPGLPGPFAALTNPVFLGA